MTRQETHIHASRTEVESDLGVEHADTPEEVAPAEYWEARYGSAEKMWSGRVNQVLAHTVSEFDPGRALDLGCGEGGDVVWLAKRGWHATGIDISETAIQRARAAAHAAGLTVAQANFRVADLAALAAEEQFDLVTASFLHSPVELPREHILRRAAAHVAPGGHLLITAHAAPPPWAADLHHHGSDGQGPGDHSSVEHEAPEFPLPEDELSALDLNPEEWDTVIAQTRDREAVAPDGAHVVLTDGIVLVRRRAAAVPQ
ncbi:class I SAM-dependent methyltransferase [Leucobacter sp. W1038]|uniref:class I SAM-dependent methyltransferase n=1 Tax=Leucobacter sp. W1038 TaxID=3438281 RepID=UPI003D989ECA